MSIRKAIINYAYVATLIAVLFVLPSVAGASSAPAISMQTISSLLKFRTLKYLTEPCKYRAKQQ